MAVHDQSYTPWAGPLASRASRVRAIVQAGLGQPFKNIWTLLVVILTFVVAGGLVLLLFVFSTDAHQYLNTLLQAGEFLREDQRKTLQRITGLLGNNIYRAALFNNLVFIAALTVLSATVGASLISRDLKHNALLMYFSKAIRRGDYVAAKFATLALFLLFVTLGPALVLFLGQIGMGLERVTFGQRLADLGAITLHSLAIVVPTSAAVLACSATTRHAYLAGVLWAAFFFSSEGLSRNLAATVGEEWCKFLSWQNLIQHLGDQFYAARPLGASLKTGPPAPVLDASGWAPFFILLAVTAGSLAYVRWRIGRVEAGE